MSVVFEVYVTKLHFFTWHALTTNKLDSLLKLRCASNVYEANIADLNSRGYLKPIKKKMVLISIK